VRNSVTDGGRASAFIASAAITASLTAVLTAGFRFRGGASSTPLARSTAATGISPVSR
jgi:hypothetical protein